MSATRMRLGNRKDSAALNAVQRAAVDCFVVASQICSWLARRTLPHMNLSTSTLKPDLVHRQLHEVEAATVLPRQSFDRQRVGNRFWIKSLPLVGDDNGHSLSQLTLTTDLNQLVSVRPMAVNDCVAQSFLKRQFHARLIAGNAARTLDQSHQPVHQRRDSFDFTRHPSLDFEQGTSRVYSGKCWPQSQSPIRLLCSAHGNTSRTAPCQPKPIAHGIRQPKSLAVAQDAVPPVPPTSED